MQSQFRSPEVARPVGLRRLAGDLHSVAKQGSSKTLFWASLVDFGAILGGLGRPKRKSKSILESFFSDVFSNRVWASFWDRFLDG